MSANWTIRALAYYIVLFPSTDVLTAFPLALHIVTGNLFNILRGRDITDQSESPKIDSLLHFIIKLVSATLPIVTAMFLSNLIYILKYAGSLGFIIALLFPTALQLRSIWVCNKTFTPQSEPVEMKESSLSEKVNNPESKNVKCSDKTKTSGQKSLTQMFANYQTPYSSRFISHPIAVTVIGAFGLVVSVLGVSSLLVHPHQLFCKDEP